MTVPPEIARLIGHYGVAMFQAGKYSDHRTESERAEFERYAAEETAAKTVLEQSISRELERLQAQLAAAQQALPSESQPAVEEPDFAATDKVLRQMRADAVMMSDPDWDVKVSALAEIDLVRATLDQAEKEIARLREENRQMRQSLRNVYMLAARTQRRGRVTPEELDGFVRFCVEAGCGPSMLREVSPSVPQEVPGLILDPETGEKTLDLMAALKASLARGSPSVPPGPSEPPTPTEEEKP